MSRILNVLIDRVLVVIANYGMKNRSYLDRIIWEYQSMNKYDVDIVVLSDVPKNIGSEIEVLVGLPADDPWSLPYGYKKIFNERKDEYALYIYSEDDTLITESNIDAFVEETSNLPEEYIAGFIRHEIDVSGKRYISTMHSHYHWDARSVKRFGGSIFAYYTNEHSACFILNNAQLHHALHTKRFMLPPRCGKYDMLVTAATEPYTECGMKKIVCISRIEDFCLHHLPNVYYGKMGLDESTALHEISKLASYVDLHYDILPNPLIDPEPLDNIVGYNKKYYESMRNDVIDVIPNNVRMVLSVGCGCGSTEAALIDKGMIVFGIPMDEIISITAEKKGVIMLPSNLQLAYDIINYIKFDCIIYMDILHHLTNPVSALRIFTQLLHEDGISVISMPNWDDCSSVKKRILTKLKGYTCPGSVLTKPTQQSCINYITNLIREESMARGSMISKHSKSYDIKYNKTFAYVRHLHLRHVVMVAKN